jgi:hypothetical protein
LGSKEKIGFLGKKKENFKKWIARKNEFYNMIQSFKSEIEEYVQENTKRLLKRL